MSPPPPDEHPDAAAMAITTSISRFTAYYGRHGLGATIRRAVLAIKRALFSGRAILFYCDLSRLTSAPADLPVSLTVERKSSTAELTSPDLEQVVQVWNPKLAARNMRERFEHGASLWLIKFKGQLAGYGWTLQGRTIEAHYFPLAPDDVQFLDFHVFPKYRGRAIDWFLMTYALQELAKEGLTRAFAEAAEWNQASLSSIARTSFRRLGSARKMTIFGQTLVGWDGDNVAHQVSARLSDRQSRVMKEADTSKVLR